MHFVILLRHGSMHCRMDSSGMPLRSVVTALLMASAFSERVLPVILLTPPKKSHGARSGESRVNPVLRCFSRSETAEGQGLLQRYLVGKKQPRFVQPHLSFVLVYKLKNAPPELLESSVIDCLSLWQEITENYAPFTKEHDQHDWRFYFDSFASFGISDVGDFHWLILCFRVILKSSCLITIDNSMQRVWFSLKTLDYVLIYLHAVLLLIII